jgi:hypothetical protein
MNSNSEIKNSSPMDTSEKPRADAKLKTLPEARQADIAEYAHAHALAETVTWLNAKGVDAFSTLLNTA